MGLERVPEDGTIISSGPDGIFDLFQIALHASFLSARAL
jgi:hypothetical protein